MNKISVRLTALAAACLMAAQAVLAQPMPKHQARAALREMAGSPEYDQNQTAQQR